jgi:hypothetical protein
VSRASKLREAAVARAVEGAGHASPAQRRAAFANQGVAEPQRALIDKVTRHAYKVTDDDVRAAVATSSEDQVFELAVCAAFGQATRQLESALAALDDRGTPVGSAAEGRRGSIDEATKP